MAKCPDCVGTDHSDCERCDANGDLALSELSVEERATIDGAELGVDHVYKEGGLGHAEYVASREAAEAAAADD